MDRAGAIRRLGRLHRGSMRARDIEEIKAKREYEEELERQRREEDKAREASTGAKIGQTLGTIGGGLLGLLAGPAAPVVSPMLAGLGGSAGSAIGGGVGAAAGSAGGSFGEGAGMGFTGAPASQGVMGGIQTMAANEAKLANMDHELELARLEAEQNNPQERLQEAQFNPETGRSRLAEQLALQNQPPLPPPPPPLPPPPTGYAPPPADYQSPYKMGGMGGYGPRR